MASKMEKTRKLAPTIRLPKSASFTKTELREALHQAFPDYSPNSYSWLIASLLSSQRLFRLGFNRYSTRPPLIYQGGREEKDLIALRAFLSSTFRKQPFVVYDTAALNEWLNLLLAQGTLLVEVEKPNLLACFYALQKKFPRWTILYKPTGDDLLLYAQKKVVALFPLTSRSPRLVGNGKMCLEKLAVDLFADRGLACFYDPSEVPSMVLSMLTSYAYEPTSLLAYAKRRRVEKSILKVIARSQSPAIKFS